jgi:hypothetical protein
MERRRGLRSGAATRSEGHQLFVLAAAARIAEKLWRPAPGPCGGAEARHPAPHRRNLSVGDGAKKAAVAQFLDPPAEGPVTALRAAVERHVNAKKVVASEYIAEQSCSAPHLTCVLAETFARLAKGRSIPRFEAKTTADRGPRPAPVEIAQRSGGVVPGGDGSRPSAGVVVDADEVEALRPATATPREVHASRAGQADGRIDQALTPAELAPGKVASHGEHLQRAARGNPRIGVKAEDSHSHCDPSLCAPGHHVPPCLG